MSLPWFPFYADAYTGDTGHLTCEEHGAYLQLMLAYYRSEKPLPGTDRALAALVKLSVERWLECKPALAPFFRAEDGFWHHDRIDDEIKECHAKHARGTAKAKLAAAARYNKKTSKDAPSTAQSKPEPSDKDAHLHLHIHPPSGGEAPPPPKIESTGLGSQIDPSFKPASQVRIDAIVDGFTIDEFETELRKFIATKLSSDAFSSDWDASFVLWLEREKAHRAKIAAKPRAAPRIEVNTTAETATVDWDRQLARWIKSQTLWSRKLCGPEPGQIGCKVPLEKLIEFNIDPTTGIVGIAKVDG